jgi:L-fuconolactonase
MQMPDFPIVDSHVHLCDPSRFAYGWMKNAPSLDRLVLPVHLTEAASPVEIDRFVFVEVDVDYPQHLAEAEWVDELAQSERRLAGMVASLPLEKGKAVEPELDQLCRRPTLRGIRRLIQSHPDPEFCIRPGFIEGVKLLASRDLVFEICIYHHQMPSAIEMARRCPDVRFVLDHIGKPGIKAGLLEPWRQHIKELASLPNVHCKISGVITEADHKKWTREQLKPYVLHAIDAFGFDRVMYGGDWHVLELAATYPQWVEILDWATESSTREEKRKLFCDNAIRFYRLD